MFRHLLTWRAGLVIAAALAVIVGVGSFTPALADFDGDDLALGRELWEMRRR